MTYTRNGEERLIAFQTAKNSDDETLSMRKWQ